MQYNALKPWQHGKVFGDRYDWQADDDYDAFRTAYDAIKTPYKCEIMKWAELRSLVGGATAVVGSSGGGCINPLIRNLDEGAGASGIPGYNLYYNSGRVTYFDDDDAIIPGYYDAVACHVAEGIEGNVRHEIDHMVQIGMEGPGQIYVHATDVSTSQLARMADQGTAIAWSPRSNLDLYAATTPADVAHRLGVPITLAPDWTWSGSMNPSRELRCASEYLGVRNAGISDITLWSWVTSEAARLLSLDLELGSFEAGLKADIAVFDWSDEPYRTVIEGDPRTVRLVMVSGNALYGHSDLVDALTTEPEWCETIDACDESRSICAQAGWAGDDAQTAVEIQEILETALDAVSMPDELDYANDLLGLFLCEDTRDSCDPSTPTDGDTDGDGILDDEDICPSTYDPLQNDHDSDELGDACDPCPLAADIEDCLHTPGDIDGDSILTDSDVCPWLYDPDQSDRDEDGKGDVCDLCPDEPNPGDMPCTLSVSDLRDPSSESYPDEGTAVALDGLIVTGVRDGVGFYVQDSDASMYGGIFIYDAGDYSSGDVSAGDHIDVSGIYSEYYGLSQLGSVTVTIIGTGTLPSPIIVEDPCSIGTDGDLAEAYESMRVRVAEVTVTNSNPDAPDDYGEFELDDCLRVDDQLSDVLIPQPPVGTYFSELSGVLTYTYGHAKIEPTGAEDVVE